MGIRAALGFLGRFGSLLRRRCRRCGSGRLYIATVVVGWDCGRVDLGFLWSWFEGFCSFVVVLEETILVVEDSRLLLCRIFYML